MSVLKLVKKVEGQPDELIAQLVINKYKIGRVKGPGLSGKVIYALKKHGKARIATHEGIFEYTLEELNSGNIKPRVKPEPSEVLEEARRGIVE